MLLILLANGFEDAEAIVTYDVLMRGGASPRLISAESSCEVISARGISVTADYTIERVRPERGDTIVIPGGGKGVAGLLSNRHALELIAEEHRKGANLAAICAGPTVLARLGLLDGKNATCYPGCEPDMGAAVCHPELSVCRDGNIITARAAGSSFDFGLAVLEMLKGKQAAEKVRADLVY